MVAKLPMHEIAPGALERATDFRRIATRVCMRLKCSAYASHRIGVLDTCGRHVTWAINAQVENGESEDAFFLGRYYR